MNTRTNRIIIAALATLLSPAAMADNTCNHGCNEGTGTTSNSSSAESSSHSTAIAGAAAGAVAGALGIGQGGSANAVGGAGGSSSAAGGNSSATGGTSSAIGGGSSANSFSSRALAIGAAAVGSPANDTCAAYVSILFGATTYPREMPSCAALNEALFLVKLGENRAAIERLCQLPSIGATSLCATRTTGGTTAQAPEPQGS